MAAKATSTLSIDAFEWTGVLALLVGFALILGSCLTLIFAGGVVLKAPYFVQEFSPPWIAVKAAVVPFLGPVLGPPLLLFGPLAVGFALLKLGLACSDAAKKAKAKRKD